MMLYDFKVIGLLANMKVYFKTLDLLFKSNCKVIGPIALREMMKNRMRGFPHDIENKDLFIDVWKQNQDPEKLSKTTGRALEIL